MLKKLLEKIEPLFKPGGRLERLYPLYEANDTFLFTPGEVTQGETHIRDAIDTKRMMSIVILALVPCIVMAMYNTGYQASHIIEQAYSTSSETYQVPVPGWRYRVLDVVGVDYRTGGDFYKNFGDPYRFLMCLLHGAIFFLPAYLVTIVAGGLCEVAFSVIRRHEINEGFLVTSMLFPLTLPPTIPLWQVAVGIMFGVVVGKEVFGGTGRNFLNPALTARAFLYFAYAPRMSGNAVWTAVDGFSGATALGAIKIASNTSVENVIAGMEGVANKVPIELGFSWWDAFWGNMHGSMGETSVFCCLLGAVVLIATRIGSWRIMSGMVLGLVVTSGLFMLTTAQATSYHIAPWWHLVLGGFAFGAVFMATDPVSAAMTETGKWWYGGLIGFMTVLVRAMNIGFAEGVMLAILFGNVFAPLIDYYVMQFNIQRRMARHAA